MAQRKEKAYISRYEKSAVKNGGMTIAERRKTVGEHLSFAAAEAYKLLRTNLMFSMSDADGCKIIGVTSSLRGEGKSTTSINLAYSIAKSGKKVLLVEGDMRIPVIADVLEIQEKPGLSHVLAGLNEVKDAIRYPNPIGQMAVMPAGEIPPNPSEMLSSNRMKQLISALSESFEYIILDLPPINAVSDGLAVSGLLSGMIMVVRQNYCDRASLATAMRQLDFLQVKLLGFVVSHAESQEKRYKRYSYSYRYGYGYKYKTPYRKVSDYSDFRDVEYKIPIAFAQPIQPNNNGNDNNNK